MNQKNTIAILTGLVMVTLLFSTCKKLEDKIGKADADVYICGRENLRCGVTVAKYWKNGEEVFLTDSISGRDAGTSSIFVAGNDIYVGGHQWDNSWAKSKYWKNGMPVSLSNGMSSSWVNSIAVYNSDVHVAMSEEDSTGNHVVKHFKNGVGVNLGYGYIGGMAVSDNDVYVAEHQNGINYWKNGVKVNVTNDVFSTSTSIFVVGSDVYLSGSSEKSGKNQAKYWKNGQEVILTNGSFEARATSIFVSGNDVYVAGYERKGSNQSVAKYWKNGIEVILPSEKSQAQALCIAVSGSDVYVAGKEEEDVLLWKNGQLTKVGRGYPSDMVVVQH
jgi:hypothetical protein